MSENCYKETLETLYKYHLPRNFYEGATKVTLKIQILKKTCVDKVINFVQLLIQSDRETYCYR